MLTHVTFMDTSCEHGDTEFPLWSHTTVGVQPILDVVAKNPKFNKEDLEQI